MDKTVRLSFMGVCEPEEFRCRVYWVPDPPPLSREEAIAWLLDSASKSPNGFSPPHSSEWMELIDEMCDNGDLHWYSAKLFAGRDFLRPEELTKL